MVQRIGRDITCLSDMLAGAYGKLKKNAEFHS